MNRNDMYGGIIVTMLVFTWGLGYMVLFLVFGFYVHINMYGISLVP
jgi:hypothetical protein